MKISKDKVVTLEFKVYDNKTSEMLEDTREVGPFFYLQGNEQFVPKVEEVLEGKEKGFKTTIFISPEEGYGEYDEELVEKMAKEDFVEFDDIYEGMEFVADMDDGSEVLFIITSIEDDVVTADGNHPFAGKELKFEVEVTGVREATEEELAHGHVHFHGFEDDCDCDDDCNCTCH